MTVVSETSHHVFKFNSDLKMNTNNSKHEYEYRIISRGGAHAKGRGCTVTNWSSSLLLDWLCSK